MKVYYDIVEQAIHKLGVDPKITRTQNGRWSLRRNDNSILVFVTPQKKNPSEYYFQVSAPLIKTPQKQQEAFFQQLLKLNNQLVGAAFVEFSETIYLSAIRDTKQLSVREAMWMINRIGIYANFYTAYKASGILNWPLYSYKPV